ncbi:hypothetical protein [Paenibacillus ginsengarvi]|uniref:GyrI-like small molecule binding domain-containing protein n=1 Tax=Paenibacillus ginsengarvi TaxID=400777 RepID=A0A3B0BFC6_9BACL|nr:hypothetical protein [Paenibacillus ginsengarvi]RKN71903.1 hypothetical protein D7M11_29180 [Paenibacillus ginsengarvi]
MNDTLSVEVVTVPPMRLLTVQAPTVPDKSGTRAAWRKLTEVLPQGDPRLADPDTGYVCIPQEQWAPGVETLYVGLRVGEAEVVPDGTEPLDTPECCAPGCAFMATRLI